MGTVASRVFFLFNAEAVRIERNGLTNNSMNQYVRKGVSQPPFSFAAFDLRRLFRRYSDACVSLRRLNRR